MFSLFLCFCALILFILKNGPVMHGAATGLMLWYRNVIPVLLPFMILSNIIVAKVKEMSLRSHTNQSSNASRPALTTTFLLGVFCGYPLGAKTASDFVREGIYSPGLGNLIVPVCNNSSPMFIAGYIVHTLLSDAISLPFAMLMIYMPYLFFLALSAICIFISRGEYGSRDIHVSGRSIKKCRKASFTENKNTVCASNVSRDYMLDSVIQITYVGIYIMLCSIIIEFLAALPGLSPLHATLLSGITEITNGTYLLAVCAELETKIKTALILAVTSFGGISAILQTNKVISTSGLSIISYVCIKLLCATGTYIMTILFI